MADDESFATQTASWMETIERRLAKLEDTVLPPASEAEADAATADTLALADDDIRSAYRLLLNREPDPVGFAMYRQRAATGLSHGDLVSELMISDERAALQSSRILEVDVGGVKVCVDSHEGEFGRAIARDGTWEAHIVAQIAQSLSEGGVFVDIGANVGVMSFHAARAVGRSGGVIAFEPNPENVQRFLQGVSANGFEQIRLLPLAASDRPSIFGIKGGSNTYLAPASRGMRLAMSVIADDVLALEQRIDVVKIDIEGHEPFALHGLSRTIERHHPLLLIEFNPRCLNVCGSADPAAFAAEIHAFAQDVAIIEHDGSLTQVADADALMAMWRDRNEAHVQRGDLADGMLHFDLRIRT